MKAAYAALILFLFLAGANAQTGSDACHVYILDIAKSQRAFERFHQTGNAEADDKALAVGQTLFPEFYPLVGEEELTTKHYPFPKTKLVITASVFYTDESMASHPHGSFTGHSESMLIGVTVANIRQSPMLLVLLVARVP